MEHPQTHRMFAPCPPGCTWQEHCYGRVAVCPGTAELCSCRASKGRGRILSRDGSPASSLCLPGSFLVQRTHSENSVAPCHPQPTLLHLQRPGEGAPLSLTLICVWYGCCTCIHIRLAVCTAPVLKYMESVTNNVRPDHLQDSLT